MDLAFAKSQGKCALNVRIAVQRAQNLPEAKTGIVSAKDYGPWLLTKGYILARGQGRGREGRGHRGDGGQQRTPARPHLGEDGEVAVDLGLCTEELLSLQGRLEARVRHLYAR
jgi:hypothetical protein